MKQVALVGYSHRLPGTDTAHFWQDLLNGRDLVSSVAPDRWALAAYLHPDRQHPGTSYTFKSGSIGNISGFDASFFGISPREANQMDPQQRLLLELAWETFENAGILPSSVRGSRCGVYIGISSLDYAYRMADDLGAVDAFVATGNTSSIAANRISYLFDLRGPSMAIDTACSSSLVAFHQACQAIAHGECDQALAGGVSLHMHPFGFVSFSKASMLSPTGKCRVFDADADGYVRSEGAGLFLLKDLDLALKDNDQIFAVVAATAVNTDGKKSGITVPSSAAQAALMEEACRLAGIKPEQIDYLEAHGTGTLVGDPVETHAIGMAIGKQRPLNNPLLIGSVKSNIGHLEAAAGVAGLVKALLCIQHRMVPATIGIKKTHPSIHLEEWNLVLATETVALTTQDPILIGVNSFGFGGANAHVILKEYLPANRSNHHVNNNRTLLPLLISAKDPTALTEAAAKLADVLDTTRDNQFYTILYNLIFRRELHEHRAVLFSRGRSEAARELHQYAHGEGIHAVQTGQACKTVSGIGFVYSGNGSQWEGMGRLLLNDPVFLDTIKEIDHLFLQYTDWSIEADLAKEVPDGRYARTELAQPTLFALQVGMTRMLAASGVVPSAVAGHSVGEIAAAWACGAVTLPDAVMVIFHRSRLQGTTAGKGQMTAVSLGREAMNSLIEDHGLSSSVVLAACNSANAVTIAGDLEDLVLLEDHLVAAGITFKRLDLDYAFHSPAMDSIEKELISSLQLLVPDPSVIPFYSGVTGMLCPGEQLHAAYWWDNIRKPVLFEQTIENLLTEGVSIFLEVGPHPILRGYLQDTLLASGRDGKVLPTLMRHAATPSQIQVAAAQSLIAGGSFHSEELFPVADCHLQLPNYAWQREFFWHRVTPESSDLLHRQAVHPLLGYPLKQHELVWENQLDTVCLPFLSDHRVGNATVFPGTGFIELGLAAAVQWQPSAWLELEQVSIHTPILLDSGQTKLTRLSIDSVDGSFTVNVRTLSSDEKWSRHVTGRILKTGSTVCLGHQQEYSLPARMCDLDAARHESLTHAAGLDYGSAFQWFEKGWIEEGSSVTALLRVPQSLGHDLESYILHPGLLDTVFQLIIHLLPTETASADMVFVPVSIGRIRYCSGSRLPRSAQARLLRLHEHSLNAEYSLYDESGSLVAIINDVRMRAVRLKNQAQPQHLVWKQVPAPLPEAKIPLFLMLQSFDGSLGDLSRFCQTDGIYRRYTDELEPLLDLLCVQYVLELLYSLAGKQSELSRLSLLSITAEHPEFIPLFEYLLGLAQADQALIATDSGWGIVMERLQPAASEIWISLLQDYPDHGDIIREVGNAGYYLADLLNKTEKPDVLGQEVRYLQTVLGQEGRYLLGSTLLQNIQQTVATLGQGSRLEIIECCEGTPLLASFLCRHLDPDRVGITLYPVSPEQTDSLMPLTSRFPAVHSSGAVMDRGSQPCYQQVDLILITTDFTTLSDAEILIEQIMPQLKPGGLLLLAGLHHCRWQGFVSCLNTKVQNYLNVPAIHWQAVLERYGIEEVTQHNLTAIENAGPFVLLGKKSEVTCSIQASTNETANRHWLVIAESSGYEHKLASATAVLLKAQGDHVIIAAPDSAEALSEIFNTLRHQEAIPDGILVLAGLGGITVDTDSKTAFTHQIERCATTAALVQALETAAIETTVWLLTGDLFGTVHHNQPLTVVGDASLWGMGRTLMNEVVSCSFQLLDLPLSLPVNDVAALLVEELAQPDQEQERIRTASGQRMAPRLVIASVPGSVSCRADYDSSLIRLAFQLPGRLRNLRWEQHLPRIPLDGEIEVTVKATGLNFRDVMYTLGMLGDEAVESGFSGATLGLEFSGIVRSVGSAVTGFRPGDRVMGFSPASFANRIITPATAVVQIPGNCSFESAATIPAAFFTAFYALHHLARLQPGESVLIHGAAGGVGLAAIQVAKWCGATLYATAGSDRKRSFLAMLGVDYVFDSRGLDFAQQILEVTGGSGVDVVLNSLAGEAINRNLAVLKPFGRFLELGKRDFYENTKIGLRPFKNNISYFGIDADQLMVSRPDLTHHLFTQMMDLFRDGVFHPLPHTIFEAADIVDAFRYMRQSRQIGKIVVTYRDGFGEIHDSRPQQKRLLELSAGDTFLITGGLSGLGLKSAQWLVDKGCRNLVLASRSGKTGLDEQVVIRQLKTAGVAVMTVACDVTDRQALELLLNKIALTLPPLRGIIHAAMVIDDGLVRNLDRARITSVLAPKILGAWNLHELTVALPVRYFIMFSSCTTMFGNPGQSSYVAANSWLEQVTELRRASGLPATCIALGVIDDVGYLARNEAVKKMLLERIGGGAISSGAALDMLEQMIVNDAGFLGLMPLDWHELSRSLPALDTMKYHQLRRIFGTLQNREEQTSGDLLRLHELPETEMHAAIVELLLHETSEILRLASGKIDVKRSLYEMGLDSLMGVELVVALEARLGIRIPVMALSEHPTIHGLAERIVHQLLDARETSQAKDLQSQIEQIAKQHDIGVSEEYVSSFIEELAVEETKPASRIIE